MQIERKCFRAEDYDKLKISPLAHYESVQLLKQMMSKSCIIAKCFNFRCISIIDLLNLSFLSHDKTLIILLLYLYFTILNNEFFVSVSNILN